jgi:prepilin-type N-terminal cleavage/methylation domain-containing protein/prepilin-type processing-associated H-X9-DG protein
MRGMSSRRGFTLIELLVVIAIIAILAAVLFPVIMQAKERGRTAMCQAHEKELYAALMLYVDDYHGMLPYMQFLCWWIQGNWEVHLYDKYVRNDEIVICPQAYYDEHFQEVRRQAYGYNQCLLSPLGSTYYGGKVQVHDVHIPGSGRMMSDVRTPSRTAVFFCTFANRKSPEDNKPRGFGWEARDAINKARHPNRHSGGANYCFLDGHVVWRLPQGGGFVVPIEGLDYDGNGSCGTKEIMR